MRQTVTVPLLTAGITAAATRSLRPLERDVCNQLCFLT
jgi:hypothetical protein